MSCVTHNVFIDTRPNLNNIQFLNTYLLLQYVLITEITTVPKKATAVFIDDNQASYNSTGTMFWSHTCYSAQWGALCTKISQVSLHFFTDPFHEDFFSIIRRHIVCICSDD